MSPPGVGAGPQFYYTVHKGDVIRARLIPGARVMLVAAAAWDADAGRLRVTRPPADTVSGQALDSGGFTAARRWGTYPFSYAAYVQWARETSRDVALDFVAGMDYACERDVNRTTLATNRERIRASIRNELALRRLAPDLPWLGVLQGNTLAERAWDLRFRARVGLLTPYMGIGSICGRTPAESRTVIRFYAAALPGARFHAFGLHIGTLDSSPPERGKRGWVGQYLASFDTYAWNWGRGQKDVDRPVELYRQPGESYSTLTRRLAEFYAARVLAPRLTTGAHQLTLLGEGL